MASLTQWTWVWANSGRWWRIGKPGVLQSTGSQRVRCNWATKQQQEHALYKVNSLPLFSSDTCAEMQVATTWVGAKTVPGPSWGFPCASSLPINSPLPEGSTLPNFVAIDDFCLFLIFLQMESYHMYSMFRVFFLLVCEVCLCCYLYVCSLVSHFLCPILLHLSTTVYLSVLLVDGHLDCSSLWLQLIDPLWT